MVKKKTSDQPKLPDEKDRPADPEARATDQGVSDEQVKCPSCDHFLINTPSGAICPKGHHGVFRRVSSHTHRLGLMQLAGDSIPEAFLLPIAIRSAGAGPVTSIAKQLFSVQDHHGIWHRVRRTNPKENDTVIAQLGEAALELRRWTALEERIGATFEEDDAKDEQSHDETMEGGHA